jgi:AcrR family transcriptional regulator
MARAQARVRRSQEERSAETRAKLLQATIECLYEHGYAATTTIEIARRAGLSRGAQLHHFPTKAELVTTAVERLLEQRNEEFREAFERLPVGVNRAAEAVDLLWKILSGPTFYAWLEVVLASRTDENLRRTVAAMAARYVDTVNRTFRELFRPHATPFVDVAPMFAISLCQGLALDRIVVGDDRRITTTLEKFKLLANMVIP